MKVIQSREIRMDNLWEPELFGIFTEVSEKVIFYFVNRYTLYSYEDGDNSPHILQINSDRKSFPLPYTWKILKTSFAPILVMNESVGINLADNKLISEIPSDLLIEYKKQNVSEKHFEEDSFLFGDYCISHKGLSGYSCTKNEAHCWDFVGRAYLYTEISLYKDKIYFGTAGNSGYFYILNLDTGVPITKIKTGGTACIEQVGDFCYFLQYDKVTSLLCVEIHSGRIVEQIVIPGKSSELSRIQIIGNKIHAITFQYKRGNLQSAIWTTVQL